MKVRYGPGFFRQYKKANVRIRGGVDEKIRIFLKDPDDPQLDNHELREEYTGYKSIDITADWRAVYKEIHEGDNIIAYFVALGTHKELYGKQ